MKINLYYVEGISRIDTPSFNTKTHIGTIQDQEEFFLTKLVKSIDMTFYPPYYRNSIKFDQDDLVITDNVNYLSLEYNGKTYYYFIDEINYTSTGIITLEVSMDTIQTFMFDIYISSGIIERKFINRWIDDKINRNYKRENVSDGLYETFTYNKVNHKDNWFVFYKYTDSNSGINIVNDGLNFEDLYYPCDVLFHPYLDREVHYNGQVYTFETNVFVKDASDSAILGEVFVIPFNPFYESDFSSDGYVDSNKFDVYPNSSKPNVINYFMGHSEFVHELKTYFTNIDIKTYSYTFDFIKNDRLRILYNSRYMPVMFDENYYRVIFGSRATQTSVPLYKYDFLTITGCYYADILSGSRFYYISSSFTDKREDKYRTLVADIAPIKLDVINDKYAEFNANNKYRWFEAVGGSLLNVGMLFATVGLKSAFAAKDIAKIAATSLTPKRQQLSKKGKRAIESIERGLRDDIPGNIDKGFSSLSPITGQAIQDANMMYAPDSIKQSNSVSDITSSAYQIIFEIQRVNDYEQCAQYYHHNGYLVHEYITQVSNIFLSVRNRYYFDVLKMSLPEVHLHNIIEDEDTVGLIEERFETGLRLWNVKNSDVIMGDFTYDNVELDYLS